jgi:hypothetical protein
VCSADFAPNAPIDKLAVTIMAANARQRTRWVPRLICVTLNMTLSLMTRVALWWRLLSSQMRASQKGLQSFGHCR